MTVYKPVLFMRYDWAVDFFLAVARLSEVSDSRVLVPPHGSRALNPKP